MLISFSVANFLSFRDQVELNMLAVDSSDKELSANLREEPINRIRGSKYAPLLKSAVIYGPNASGKSNLLTALLVMADLISKSHESFDFTIITPFLLDPTTRTEPSEFETRILIDGSIYRYGFTIGASQVYDEWLFIADKGAEKLIFEREWSGGAKTHIYEYGATGKKPFKDIQRKVRPDALLLSVGAQFNVEKAVIMTNYFKKCINLENDDNDGSNPFSSFKRLFEPPDEFEVRLLTEVLRFADIGLERLELLPVDTDYVATKMFPSFSLAKDRAEAKGPLTPARLQSAAEEIAKELKKRGKHKVAFNYKDSGNNIVSIPDSLQSDGTMSFLEMFLAFVRKYQSGGLLICDEVEASLHPLLCEAILRVFHNLPNNNLQLICTTHNPALLNADIFRRDQVWILEKAAIGQSAMRSLVDFKGVRKGAKLGKQYLEGLFGGLPVLDERILQNIINILAENRQGD